MLQPKLGGVLTLLGASLALAHPYDLHVQKRSNTTGAATTGLSLQASGAPVFSAWNSTATAWNASRSAVSTDAVAIATEVASADPTAEASSTYTFPYEVFDSIPTLQPVIPDDHDLDNPQNIVPYEAGPAAPLHYAQESDGEYSGGVYAVVTPNFKVPSVVLDNAAAVTSVQMARGGDLVIGFSDVDSFNKGLGSWQNSGDLVFVTYTPGCGDFADGERCYFYATGLTFDQGALTVRASGAAKDIKDITNNVQVTWGSYSDVNYGSNGTAASTSAVGAASATVASSSSSASATLASVSLNRYTSNCTAPVDTKYGLPTTCTGPDFDDNLDEGLGYKTSKDFSWSDLVESTTLDTSYDDNEYYSDDTSISKRGAKEWLAEKAKKVSSVVVNTSKSVSAKVSSGLKEAKKDAIGTAIKVGSALKKAAEITVNVITGKPNPIHHELDKILLPPKKDSCDDAKKKAGKCKNDAKVVESPWKDDGILLKSFGNPPSEKEIIAGKKTKTALKGKFVNIYCVKCGVSGSAKVDGSITVENIKGITEGHVDVELELTVGIGLGIYAQMIWQEKIENNLMNVPLSPFTIGVLTVGPYVSLGTRTIFTANATGSILARADLSLAQAKFSYDFKKGKASQIGFTPEFRPSFEVDGEITLSAEFGIPIGLKIGLTTFKGCKYCEGAIGFEEFPSIKAQAKVGYEAKVNATINKEDGVKYNATSGLKSFNNCTGVYAGITVQNAISATFNGFGLVEKDWVLHKTPEYPLKTWCLGKKTDGKKKREIDEFPHEISLHNYPRDITNTTSNSSEIVDLTSYIVSDADTYDYDGAEVDINSYDLDEETFDGYWFTEVSFKDKSNYLLTACNDGNIYLRENSSLLSLEWYETCSALWGGYGDTILSAPNGGFLHYYNNSMAKTGVSRLRVSNEKEVPDSSVIVMLAPFYYDDDSDDSFLAAIDPDDNVFVPVVCSYKDDTESKIYLVSDLDTGLDMLQSADLKYSVTNGDVDTCYLLPLGWANDDGYEWIDVDEEEWEEDDEEDLLEFEFDEEDFNDEGLWDDGYVYASDEDLEELIEDYELESYDLFEDDSTVDDGEDGFTDLIDEEDIDEDGDE